MTFANKITVSRIILVPVFVMIMVNYHRESDYLRFWALGIFLVAILSDVLDGYWARTFNQKTSLGAVLDPVADKTLLVSAFLCIYLKGEQFPLFYFPLWIVILIIARDILILGGISAVKIAHKEMYLEASRWGKISTFLQSFAIVGALGQWQWTVFIWPLVILLVFFSFVDYAQKGLLIFSEKEVNK